MQAAMLICPQKPTKGVRKCGGGRGKRFGLSSIASPIPCLLYKLTAVPFSYFFSVDSCIDSSLSFSLYYYFSYYLSSSESPSCALLLFLCFLLFIDRSFMFLVSFGVYLLSLCLPIILSFFLILRFYLTILDFRVFLHLYLLSFAFNYISRLLHCVDFVAIYSTFLLPCVSLFRLSRSVFLLSSFSLSQGGNLGRREEMRKLSPRRCLCCKVCQKGRRGSGRAAELLFHSS